MASPLMQHTYTSLLSGRLSSNLYGLSLAQLQQQRQVGAFSSGAMELNRPEAPAHVYLLSATAGSLAIYISLSTVLRGPGLQESQLAADLPGPMPVTQRCTTSHAMGREPCLKSWPSASLLP